MICTLTAIACSYLFVRQWSTLLSSLSSQEFCFKGNVCDICFHALHERSRCLERNFVNLSLISSVQLLVTYEDEF